MAESEQNEKTTSTIPGDGIDEREIKSADEVEEEEEEEEEAEEENDEVVEDDDDSSEKVEEEEVVVVVDRKVQPQKKPRCQRKKKKPCCVKENEAEEGGEKEEEEEEEGGGDDDEEKKVIVVKEGKKAQAKEEKEGEEEEEEGEEAEEEESDIISTGFSVLSAVSFVWENEIYEFEELCDPGNIETIYQGHISEPQELDEYGINRYLQLCTTMKIPPMISLLRFLKTNEIDLSYHNVASNNIKAMCAALEINNTVKKLILKYNKLKVEDCLYIGHIMYSNQKISHLDFTGCRIGPQGLQLIIPYLLKHDTVVHLNLSKCNIEDEGMKSLAYILMSSIMIQEVDLSYNKLGEESAGALAWVFKTNNSIKTLNLRYNNLLNPTSMRGFMRYLSISFSITSLDLSWNGLNGVDMGIIIGNFLRRSESIEYLDLSDNRFQGAAVAEIQLGLSRSSTLRTLKIGKNPISPDDSENLLFGARWCRSLKILDLEDIWVNSSFIKNLQKIQQEKDFEVVCGGVYNNYTAMNSSGPDYSKIILQRAQFEAQEPQSVKMKKDFGHFIWTLGEEPLLPDEFMLRVKTFKAKINKELFPELMKQFKIPKSKLINVIAMKEKYLSIFPNSKPPPARPKSKNRINKTAVTQEYPEAPKSKTDINETEVIEEYLEEDGESEEDFENFDGNEIVEAEEKEEANE